MNAGEAKAWPGIEDVSCAVIYPARPSDRDAHLALIAWRPTELERGAWQKPFAGDWNDRRVASPSEGSGALLCLPQSGQPRCAAARHARCLCRHRRDLRSVAQHSKLSHRCRQIADSPARRPDRIEHAAGVRHHRRGRIYQSRGGYVSVQQRWPCGWRYPAATRPRSECAGRRVVCLAWHQGSRISIRQHCSGQGHELRGAASRAFDCGSVASAVDRSRL